MGGKDLSHLIVYKSLRKRTPGRESDLYLRPLERRFQEELKQEGYYSETEAAE